MVYKEKAPDFKNASFLNKFTFTTITALILVLPWLFNTQISNQVEISKNIIISIVISFILFVWAITLFKQKGILWYSTPIDKAIILILISTLLSVLFSIHTDTSIWGYRLRQTGGFMSLCSLVLLFSITVQNLRDDKTLIRVVKFIPFSLGLYALYSLLKVNNVLESINQNLALGLTTINPLLDPMISLAGDIKAITIAFILALPIALFVLIDKRNASPLERALGFIIASALILGVFSNLQSHADLLFKIIICAQVIAIIIFALIFSFRLKNSLSVSLILNLILLGVSIIASLIILNSPSPAVTSIPIETTTSIVTSINQTNSSSVLFGTGLDTYIYDFARYRPETQNLQPDWYINHTTGNSQLEGIIINSGLMGLLGLVVLMYFILKFIAVNVLKARLHAQNSLLLALCTSTILFLFSFFFSNHSLVLSVFGWLIFALLFLCYSALDPNSVNKYVIEFKWSSAIKPTANMAPKMLSMVIVIIGSALLFFSIKNLMSEIYFQQTLDMAAQGKYEDANTSILTALKYNDGKDYYYSELASISMVRLLSYLETPNSDLDEDPTVALFINEILGSITNAIQLNPVNYQNWQTASILNKQLFELFHDSKYEQNAIDSIEQALIRYPNEPDSYLLLAELYEIGSNPQKKDLAAAAYTKAYSLQPSYIVSILRLGRYLEQENEKEMALALYSISRQEFYPTESDFNSYLTARIEAVKLDLEE